MFRHQSRSLVPVYVPGGQELYQVSASVDADSNTCAQGSDRWGITLIPVFCRFPKHRWVEEAGGVGTGFVPHPTSSTEPKRNKIKI